MLESSWIGDRYAVHLKNGRKSAHRLRLWLSELKIKTGCVDCGYKANPAALHYDHEGKKTASISELRSNPRRILAEIKHGKCVLRCAICHAVKTWAVKNGIKYRAGMAHTQRAWRKHHYGR